MTTATDTQNPETAGLIVPVVLRFDPFANEETVEVFKDDLARTLYLLWRITHLVSEGFAYSILKIAKNLRTINPKTPAQAVGAFPTNAYGNFHLNDVQDFCEKYFDYVTGSKTVEFEIKL